MATESTEGHGKIKHKNINLWFTQYPCPLGNGSILALKRFSSHTDRVCPATEAGERVFFFE